MSSTNKTTNYNLSQFIGSDKPAWLVDYNGDMSAIDTQMKANADAASAAQTTANTADGKADTNAGAISTLDSQINGASGIAADVTAVQGAVNTINSLIGNGEPTTSDKTLIGAINELDAGKLDSSDLETGMLSVRSTVSVTADGVKKFSDLFDEIVTALTAVIETLGANDKLIYHSVRIPGFYELVTGSQGYYGNFAVIGNSYSIMTSNDGFRVNRLYISSGSHIFDTINVPLDGSSMTYNSLVNSVPTNGDIITVNYEILKPVVKA